MDENELHEILRRIAAKPPEELQKGLLEATEIAERQSEEWRRKTRFDWRLLHEPMTI